MLRGVIPVAHPSCSVVLLLTVAEFNAFPSLLSLIKCVPVIMLLGGPYLISPAMSSLTGTHLLRTIACSPPPLNLWLDLYLKAMPSSFGIRWSPETLSTRCWYPFLEARVLIWSDLMWLGDAQPFPSRAFYDCGFNQRCFGPLKL